MGNQQNEQDWDGLNELDKGRERKGMTGRDEMGRTKEGCCFEPEKAK
jgi:hypothetical protein